jgi:hypothetical protein
MKAAAYIVFSAALSFLISRASLRAQATAQRQQREFIKQAINARR